LSFGRFWLRLRRADFTELQRRYRRKSGTGLKELSSYREVQKNRTERQIDDLMSIADIVIRTDRCSPNDVLSRVASCVGLYGYEDVPLVDIMVGGAYGSEGKGQLAAYLAPEYQLLVRVGGPNAGHSVFEEPDPFVFHHLPSGFAASAIFTAEPSMMESDGSRITVSSDVKPDNTSTLLP
jgi:adenylosuccinate synthase